MATNDLAEALEALSTAVATHPRDWGVDRRDSWIYGLACGWGEAALEELAQKHGWSKQTVERIERLRAAMEDAASGRS